MRSYFTFILQISVLAVLVLWLADKPGSAQIVWHDTVIETSAAFLALIVLILAFALHSIYRLWQFFRHGPIHWRLRRRISKAHEGHDQLTKGLIAIAAGNASEAGRLAVAARKNMGHSVAAHWLQAQAAQLAGDHKAAREIFRLLAADDEAAVLGYRGLITEAKRSNNWEEVDRLMGELFKLKPATPWLSLIRMESAARRRNWAEAELALSHAVTARLMESDKGKRTRAALRIASSRAESLSGNKGAALQAAEQAVKLAPDWLPALINLASMLSATGHSKTATRMIERVWKTAPHPQLAQIIAHQASSKLEAYKQIERLCKGSEDKPESRLALAEAALEADIWGEARRHLTSQLNKSEITQGLYKKLARLERLEHNDERRALSWLTKAADAPSDPVWLCINCGAAHGEWHPVCTPCGAFNSLEWQSIGKSRGALGYNREVSDND